MKTNCTFNDGVLYCSLNGEIDHHSAKNIREEIDLEMYKYRPSVLILDLEKVDFMDSSGLGLILGRYTKLNTFGGILKIANPSKKIEEILVLAGADKLFVIEKGVKNV